jgi:hypothetical protein
MYHKKIHLFSMTTPIRPGVVTYIDLGDTKHSFPPAQVERPVDVNVPMPLADSRGTPMVDLRSLMAIKRGESIHIDFNSQEAWSTSKDPVGAPRHETIPKITEKREASVEVCIAELSQEHAYSQTYIGFGACLWGTKPTHRYGRSFPP